MNILAISTSSMTFLLLGGAALILYVAGRVSLGAMPTSLDRSATRAILAAVPVLAISLIAIAMGRSLVGLHLPIACATAAMTFGLAAVMTGREMPEGVTANRAWTLLVPAVAILLIAAMGGKLDFPVLIALVAYAAMCFQSWREDPREAETHPEQTEAPSFRMSALFWLLGISAACVAGVLAILGTGHLDMVRARSSDGLVAVFLLAPAVVVPFFFELLPPCRSIGWAGSISALLKFALICIGCVLPLAALAQGVMPSIQANLQTLMASKATTQATTTAVHNAKVVNAITLPGLPSVAARADLLVLIGVSLLLIPIASGWLRPGKAEALTLLVCYVFYLLLVMVSSV